MKNLKKKLNGKKGFTLMEMLIVVAIIAILVVIAVPTFTVQLNRAKQATDDANIRTANTELKVAALNDQIDDTDKEVVTATAPTYDDGTITFSDGTTYELQFYTSVDTDDATHWEGKK